MTMKIKEKDENIYYDVIKKYINRGGTLNIEVSDNEDENYFIKIRKNVPLHEYLDAIQQKTFRNPFVFAASTHQIRSNDAHAYIRIRRHQQDWSAKTKRSKKQDNSESKNFEPDAGSIEKASEKVSDINEILDNEKKKSTSRKTRQTKIFY